MPQGHRTVELTDPHAQRRIGPALGRRMLNKVPEVTFFFWLIKIMCTTVGETAEDYLDESLGLGLTNTTIVAGVLLLVIWLTVTRRDATEAREPAAA